ncbi:hypothetical protein GQ55_9G413200 [Panicum hallii var. hallii]|uniref:Uncharacterized protein n=1 Tax=Panicum hallii var. hallii TaxID=1504633 RepID=A0A2T7CAF5_9POAL|nr:hypothetical protein GQ55_9G413200 [Panicum hallii var. hallii]
MALVIMHQTYVALLEILRTEAPRSGDGHVQVTRPIDPADPASPLLSVNASATHCCIRLIDGLHGGGAAPDYCYAASPEQEGSAQRYRLPRATITASPGTLHLARRDVAASAGPRGDHWTCADVRPDVSNRGVLGVLQAIQARVDAAIRLGASLLRMARDSGCQQMQIPKVREIAEVRVALEKMRAAVNLDAIVRRRRRCQMRRPLIQEEVACRADVVDRAHDDAEALAKRLSSALYAGQKRGRRGEEMSCRHADDAAEVLAKRLRKLHV